MCVLPITLHHTFEGGRKSQSAPLLYRMLSLPFDLVKAGSSERTDFVNEIKMMKKVAEGGNPHVVSLIGCVTRVDPLCLIIEYLKYGDLKSYLYSIKEQVELYNFIRYVYTDAVSLHSWP